MIILALFFITVTHKLTFNSFFIQFGYQGGAAMSLVTDLLDGEELTSEIFCYLDDHDNPTSKELATRFRLVLFGATNRYEAYGFIRRQPQKSAE
jgi:hypothetical protein